MRNTPQHIATHIRTVLKNGGSAPHTIEVQRFFKEEIKSRGWYTGELRKVAVRFRKRIAAERGLPFLLQVADDLFDGDVLEEKVFAVLMLQGIVDSFSKREFRLFESWIARCGSWADHDALIHDLVGPLVALDPSLLIKPLAWAKKPGRWHRRAAAVSLVRSARERKNFESIQRVTELLLASEDDMVQKGLGWLLREAAKADPERTVEYLMAIRDRSPRLVLRTACETLDNQTRQRVLKRAVRRASA